MSQQAPESETNSNKKVLVYSPRIVVKNAIKCGNHEVVGKLLPRINCRVSKI